MRKWVDLKAIHALWLVCLIVSTLYISVFAWPVASDTKRAVLGFAYLIAPAASVIGTIMVVLIRKNAERLLWIFLAAAMAALFAGELYWAYLQIWRGIDQPAAGSFATYAFIAGYILLFFTLFAFWRLAFRKGGGFSGWLLTIILMGLLATAAWFFAMQDMYLSYLQQGMYDELINAIYPVLDVALLVGFLSTAALTKARLWPVWLMSVVIGIAMYTVGDIGFSYYALAEAYKPGTFMSNVIDVFWMSCYFMVLNGAFLRLRSTDDSREQSRWAA